MLFTVYRSRSKVAHGLPKGCSLDYWVTLMALHQGLRMGEIRQLQCRDINERSDIWTIRIHGDNDDNTVNTKASCGTLPLHRELIDRGLLRLTDGKHPESLLFPSVVESAGGRYSSWYIKAYFRLLRRIGIPAKDRKTFHSFRHNSRDACRDAEILTEFIKLLGDGTTEGVSASYGMGPHWLR